MMLRNEMDCIIISLLVSGKEIERTSPDRKGFLGLVPILKSQSKIQDHRYFQITVLIIAVGVE